MKIEGYIVTLSEKEEAAIYRVIKEEKIEGRVNQAKRIIMRVAEILDYSLLSFGQIAEVCLLDKATVIRNKPNDTIKKRGRRKNSVNRI